MPRGGGEAGQTALRKRHLAEFAGGSKSATRLHGKEAFWEAEQPVEKRETRNEAQVAGVRPE